MVYDNNPYKEGLTTSWGFACVIRGVEKTILFDTGGSSAVLLGNMQQLEKIIVDFRKLGVQQVGPCHCTGDPARRMFEEEYRKNFLEVGVGRLIEFEHSSDRRF